MELDIGNNHISLQGMAYLLEGLQICTKLQGLNLNENNISSDGVSAILDIMKNCKNF